MQRSLGPLVPARAARLLRSVLSVLPMAAAAVALALGLGSGLTGCGAARSPQLHVLGVHEEPRHEVVFVQVTNPASHPMRLTKLEYRFAAAGETVSEGEVALAREVPAGAAVVVEIPLDSPSEKPMTLSGKLTAELDQIIQIFSVSAQIDRTAPPFGGADGRGQAPPVDRTAPPFGGADGRGQAPPVDRAAPEPAQASEPDAR